MNAARRTPRDPVFAASLTVVALCLGVLLGSLLWSIIKGPPFPILKDPMLFWASFVLVGVGGGILGLAWRRRRQNRAASLTHRRLAAICALALIPATVIGVIL